MILPLLKFVNKKDGLAYPSLYTLAIVSEVAEKTAGLGVKGFEGLPGFTKHRYITARGHIAYRYHIIEPLPDYKHSIYISHDFINGGNWAQLSSTAKALFPVLMYFAWRYKDEYCYLEDLDPVPSNYNGGIYKERKYDLLNAEESIICEFAGVSRKSLDSAYNSLLDHKFIDIWDTHKGRIMWKIFTVPTETYPRDWLNKKTKERYG